MARPTKPALWESAKKKVRAGSDGGKPGRWSARKTALSQLEYKKQGGDWKKMPKPPKPKKK